MKHTQITRQSTSGPCGDGCHGMRSRRWRPGAWGGLPSNCARRSRLDPAVRQKLRKPRGRPSSTTCGACTMRPKTKSTGGRPPGGWNVGQNTFSRHIAVIWTDAELDQFLECLAGDHPSDAATRTEDRERLLAELGTLANGTGSDDRDESRSGGA